MRKAIPLLFLVALAAGFYALMTASAQGAIEAPTATAPPSPTITSTTPPACTVWTGIEGGTVNLRACPGSMCGAVLDILTEGESLAILFTAGEYVRVTNASGAAGWLNSKYCKGK